MFYKTDLIGVIGLIITIVGFFLTPFLIGIPIMMVGWLILLYSVFKHFVDLIVPKDVQTKVVQETIKGYEPYKPAMSSLLKLIWEMVKIAFLFVGAIVVLLLFANRAKFL
jgi:hypothetical protein